MAFEVEQKPRLPPQKRVNKGPAVKQGMHGAEAADEDVFVPTMNPVALEEYARGKTQI